MPLPEKEPVLQSDGRISRIWLRALSDTQNNIAGSASAADLTALEAAVDTLTTTVNVNNVTLSAEIAAIPTVSTSGIVVSNLGVLTTRTLVAGANVTLTNADGTGGDITIAASGGVPALVLYDETGRALFDENGLELFDGE